MTTENKVEEVISKNRNMEYLKPTLGRFKIDKIKNENQIETSINDCIIKIIYWYYIELYQQNLNS